MGEVMQVVGMVVIVVWALMLFGFMGVILWVVYGEATGQPRLKRKAVRSTMPAIEWVQMTDEQVRRLMPPARMDRRMEEHLREQQRYAREQAGLMEAQTESMVLQEIVVDQMDRDSKFGAGFDAGSGFGSGSW